MSSVRLGNVAEWVGGVGAAGALIASIFVVRSEVQHRIRSQAACLAAWVDRLDASNPGRHVIVVANGSSQPVYDVIVWDGTKMSPNRAWHSDPGWDHAALVGTIGPLATKELSWRVIGAVLEDPWLNIVLVDSASRHWLREGSTLRRIRNRSRYLKRNLPSFAR